MYFKYLAATAAFILIGAGCTLPGSAPINDLPTTPPDDSGAMVLPEVDDEVLMDADSDTMMDDTQASDTDDTMMQDDAMENDDGAMMDDDAMVAEKKPYYIAYTSTVAEAATKEGRPVVLYFWAGWCPICKAEEPKIKSWIESSEHPIAGFRVNYDTESALKSQYKVPYQHTTIFLNKEGVEVERFSGPVTEAQFRAALALSSK